MKTTLNDIGKLLKSDEKSTDKHYYGVVQSINYITVAGKQVADSYNVSLGGTTDTVKCRKLAGAKVGDTVLVTLLSTGTGIVTNTVGGDTDATDALTTAEEAQETAEEAQEAAESAIVSANGKTKNYYQASQPTGGTYTVGDTWFDTDDDNKMYEWNGSSWVAITFGENAITDDSISTTKIKDAAITNAKIANLDAGKITTGTINANRIGATSITIGKLGTDVTTTINAKANSADLSSVATSGSYDDLSGSPTNLSDFTNDENYQTATQVSTTVNNHHDSTKYDASNPNGYTDDTAADAAQDTADSALGKAEDLENLITLDGTGVKVRNASYPSHYTKVDSTGLKIYQSNSEVASFGSSSAHLGKNSTSSSIYMCGDGGVMSINNSAFNVGSSDYNLSLYSQDGACQLDMGSTSFTFTTGGSYSTSFGYTDSDGFTLQDTSLTDWVIEQGTSSNWYYRKWKSGKKECWRNYSASSIVVTTGSGPYYGDISSVSFPSSFFATVPTIQTSIISGLTGWLGRGSAASTTATGNIRVYRTAKLSSGAGVIGIYAIGS